MRSWWDLQGNLEAERYKYHPHLGDQSTEAVALPAGRGSLAEDPSSGVAVHLRWSNGGPGFGSSDT